MEQEHRGKRKLAAILSADVVGYSRLMGEDDRATVETLKAYRTAIQQLVETHHGRVVNAPGDALLAEFSSAVEAVQCAVEVQADLTERNAVLPADRQMRYRIGVNLGDVIEEADGTLYGDGVNVAARLEALAEAGGICVSGNVFDEVERRLHLGFDFLGEHRVKNIAKPVRVYRVRAGGRTISTRAKVRALWRRRRRGLIAAAAAILVIGAGVASWQVVRARQVATDPVLALPKGPSVAVLPFANLSGDANQDYFADGITEQIIAELTRFRDLRVIARNSTFKYKGQPVDVRQVGRELGSDYVLEGSVRRDAQTIRVTAQLLDAQDGGHLWAQTYERQLTAGAIFGVQDDITARVVGAIGGAYGVISRSTWEQSRKKGPASLDAYDCVLVTREYWRTNAERDHIRARECLERAVKLNPDYAEAWAYLAMVYGEEHLFGFNLTPNPLDRSFEAARRAIELDPTLQRAQEALAYAHYYRGDLDAFLSLAEPAVAMNPNNEDALATVGNFMVYSNMTNPAIRDRGLALMNKAMALNPSSHPGWYHWPAAISHWWKGEYDQALAEATKINQPDQFMTHALFGIIHGGRGQRAEAAPHIAQLLELRPSFPEKVREEWARWHFPTEVIDRVILDLRRAGLNLPPGT